MLVEWPLQLSGAVVHSRPNSMASGEDGTADYLGVAKNATLPGANSIDGRVLVVHQGEDDLVSQPSGQSVSGRVTGR